MKPTLYRLLLSLLLTLSLLEPAACQSTVRATDGGQDSAAVFSDGHTLIVFAHQDDDLLWMLPFWPVASKFLLAGYPAATVFQDLVQSLPADLKYRVRWTPIWGSVDNDI